MTLNSTDLTSFLHQNIPLTVAMGIEVDQLSKQRIGLRASFDPNRNDKSTAFGGSMAALMTLAGWSLLTHRLKTLGLNTDLVIHKQQISYHYPVKEDFTACCRIDETALETFLSTLHTRGRARIALTSKIMAGVQTAATMQAKYVAITKE